MKKKIDNHFLVHDSVNDYRYTQNMAPSICLGDKCARCLESKYILNYLKWRSICLNDHFIRYRKIIWNEKLNL